MDWQRKKMRTHRVAYFFAVALTSAVRIARFEEHSRQEPPQATESLHLERALN